MKTVCAKNWSVGSTTGGDIKGAILNVSHSVNVSSNLRRRGELDGTLWPNSDAAMAAAKARGYTVEYFSRPNAFIQLRLSPATRRHLKTKTVKERRAVLAKLMKAEGRSMTYFRQVMTEGCMRPTRNRWDDYMAGKNPEAERILRYKLQNVG